MNWTRQLPELAGWYWWRPDASSEAEVLRVDYFGSGRWDSGVYFWRLGKSLPSPVEDLAHGEWCGIVEPEVTATPTGEPAGRMAPSSQTLKGDESLRKFG